ncbi:hypothetical protein IWX87_000734 [Polaromonas sp. CG_9.7]|nr:hypothetical protein [Polaromonas sp. CG_9.7]MBG6112700.1 hypothetical protein [Polaromonas sp. CG_9.2]MDH6186175.1 hypothetical protein [Polaromonas sp. CG_23.6]
MSTKGAAKDIDMMCAKSNAETAPDPVNSAIKLFRLTCAFEKISSAAFCPSFPADTKALPSPGNVADTGFFSTVSVTDMMFNALSKKESSLNDYKV